MFKTGQRYTRVCTHTEANVFINPFSAFPPFDGVCGSTQRSLIAHHALFLVPRSFSASPMMAKFNTRLTE